jgi:hypothetical protein
MAASLSYIGKKGSFSPTLFIISANDFNVVQKISLFVIFERFFIIEAMAN